MHISQSHQSSSPCNTTYTKHARAHHTHTLKMVNFLPPSSRISVPRILALRTAEHQRRFVCLHARATQIEKRARSYPHYDTYTHTNQAAARARTNDTQWAQRPVVENFSIFVPLSKCKQTCHRKFVSAPIRGIPQCNNTRTLALSAHAHSLAG